MNIYSVINSKRIFRRHAFTLVELLVVISIIAMLLAILMPALQNARRQAQAVVCTSNIKQLGFIELLYTQDNRGCFSGSTGPGAVNNVYSDWASECSWWYYLNKYAQNKKLWVCPAAGSFPQPMSTTAATPEYPYPIGFSYNYEFGYMPIFLKAGSHYNPSGTDFSGSKAVNSIQVSRAATKILLLDSSLAWYYNYKAGYEPAKYAYRIGATTPLATMKRWYLPSAKKDTQHKADRHRGGVDITYADGHVAWMKVDDSLMSLPQWYPYWDFAKDLPGIGNGYTNQY